LKQQFVEIVFLIIVKVPISKAQSKNERLVLQRECPSNCSPNRAGAPRKHVCGTDGKTYPSACHLRRQQCQHPNSNLKLNYRGKCRPNKAAGQTGTYTSKEHKQSQNIYKKLKNPPLTFLVKKSTLNKFLKNIQQI